MSSPWSTCSVSCGGGVQSRRVICLLGERVDGVGATEENPCAQAGKRPPDTQPCNPQPCKSWATSSWSPCHGPCVGLHLAMQKRQVFCQAQTGTRLPTVECRALPRVMLSTLADGSLDTVHRHLREPRLPVPPCDLHPAPRAFRCTPPAKLPPQRTPCWLAPLQHPALLRGHGGPFQLLSAGTAPGTARRSSNWSSARWPSSRPGAVSPAGPPEGNVGGVRVVI
ncbi:hypothetical protein Z043_105986 [Scleropages formosus]|uniref:Uncharacterized protein n=1 Tax=Scleropages formosus TaxID=113540 RepID=A0A0P7XF37_SCLFO|nr:hypothetical protein Z043_105986 [Scleropages formosus]